MPPKSGPAAPRLAALSLTSATISPQAANDWTAPGEPLVEVEKPLMPVPARIAAS
jgi:hypothetical protein